MVDGGICRGSDIVKAIAAGADIVGIGRLQCWALAAGGETGVVRMLELLEDEVSAHWDCSASNLSPSSTSPICIRRLPANLPDVFSAFPLLHIEPYRY